MFQTGCQRQPRRLGPRHPLLMIAGYGPPGGYEAPSPHNCSSTFENSWPGSAGIRSGAPCETANVWPLKMFDSIPLRPLIFVFTPVEGGTGGISVQPQTGRESSGRIELINGPRGDISLTILLGG